MQKTHRQIVSIERVKSLMAQKGYDEKQMAEFLEVSLYVFRRFIGGADQTRMSCRVLYNLAKTFEVSADSFLNNW